MEAKIEEKWCLEGVREKCRNFCPRRPLSFYFFFFFAPPRALGRIRRQASYTVIYDRFCMVGMLPVVALDAPRALQRRCEGTFFETKKSSKNTYFLANINSKRGVEKKIPSETEFSRFWGPFRDSGGLFFF